ncbi:MAG: class I SAM-dependent methyltransferase, partial [Halanaerobiales bacterium]
GTGNLARTIFAEYPQVEFDLVDFSEPMLNEVDNVLAEFKGNYRKVKGDIFSIDFSPGEYDAVVSSFAIHHGRGEEEYGQLYSRIYSWLADGGIFINCDPVAGDNNYLTKLNEQTWADYLQSAGFAEVDIKQMFNNYYREDSPISLNSHFRLLQKAEFKAIDVLWKKYNFAVYLGVK